MDENFGTRLKHLIKTSDIKTNKKFCEMSGYSEQSLYNLISGKSKPSYDFIIACLDIFPDVDINWLLTGESKQSELEFKAKQLQDEVKFLRTKLNKAVKLSSNRKTSQLSFAMDF